MSENPGEKRLYTEKEVSKLLRRAAELQDAATDAIPRPGLTRAQVEQIAAEVGIDARFVREAVAEASPLHAENVSVESVTVAAPSREKDIRWEYPPEQPSVTLQSHRG
jgi:hypothetical protein